MILNVTQSDWSNYSHDNANALRSVGIECEDVKEIAHHFGYASESKILKTNEILEKIRSADLVQIMHSDLKMLNLCKIAGQKRIVVYHTGTYYRKNSKVLNDAFNPFIEFALTDQCEFMFLFGKKIKYIATAVDTDKIVPVNSASFPYTLAHYPSCSKTKGSETIVRLLTELHVQYKNNFSFFYSDKKVTHKTQLKRMSDCDMYIELFAPTQDGYPYGCYGVTAFEAAAMGKIVFTQNIYPNVYKESYKCESKFVICNTELDFTKFVEEYIRMSPEEIVKKQRETMIWLVKNHSYKSTGNKLKEILGYD
jgi:hypothetical protein